MTRKLLILNLLLTVILLAQTPKVKTGIEVLREHDFDILKGKRVGLVTNATGTDSKLKSTIDILYERKDFQLTTLFGPEHGVRGNITAGATIKHFKDSATGLQVYSLYGDTRRPKPEMLKDIDVIVYDIQDIGCRSYTYISTMGLMMDAAAQHNIPVIILDRPNPLGGNRIEGNFAEPQYFSFISQFPIPYVYGLTCGELAKYLNGENLLEHGKPCNLTVVEMEGWKRDMIYQETGLPWVLTSPHVPNPETAFYYVATGILGELGVISEGVGYTQPFQLLAADWIDAKKIADRMNDLNLPGVLFRPTTFTPFYGNHNGQSLNGVQLHITDYKAVRLMEIQFWFMELNNDLYPEKNPFKLNKNRNATFDKVCGSKTVRELFSANMKLNDAIKFINKDIDSFREKSKKYNIY